MQEHIELEDFTIQKYFKKKKAFEEVYKSLKEYKNEKIDTWSVYMNYASLGVMISLMGLIVGMIMVILDAETSKNSDESTLPGVLIIIISIVSSLVNALIFNSTNHMRLQGDRVKCLNKEKKEDMKQLFAWFDKKPSKEVTSSLWELKQIKNNIEYRRKVRLSFLSCLDHLDSTIPATIPKEIVHLILGYAGLLTPTTNELLDKFGVNTLTY